MDIGSRLKRVDARLRRAMDARPNLRLRTCPLRRARRLDPARVLHQLLDCAGDRQRQPGAVGLIEAGRLAETTGIDLVRLRDALMMSSGNSDALKDWDMISFTWALKDMQVVAEMADKAGLSLPVTGAVKELVKDARRIKASNPPNWTGKGPTKYS